MVSADELDNRRHVQRACAQPCASKIVDSQKNVVAYYHSPVSLANLMSVAGDEWVVVQMYKLVTGSYAGKGASWDCTSADWHLHWTSEPEMYCENDWLSAVNSIPSNVETVDPAFVAQQWNVNPSVANRPEPSVSSVIPSAISTAGGAMVTINGTGFTGTTNVAFGPQQATIDSVNDSQITVTSPPGAGTVDVTVTTVKGISAAGGADLMTYVAAPTVTGISPESGNMAGGDFVEITGTGFTTASAVNFGSAAAGSFSIDPSGELITATTPSGSGTVDVTVTTAGGTSSTSGADQFTYAPIPTVTALSPSCGVDAGADQVVVTGSGFTYATAVSFGSAAAGSFHVVSDGQIDATSPSGSGTVDVIVTTQSGPSSSVVGDTFTYYPTPQTCS